MKCPKCNTEYKTNLKFCPKCGEVFESNDIQLFSDIYNLDFLEIYYPNKEERIKSTKFSNKYLVFGFVYSIYKRAYKDAALSILSLIIGLLILYNLKFLIKASLGFSFYFFFFIMIFPIVLYVFYLFNFDRILLDRRKQKINKTIVTNRDKSKEELEKIFIKDSKNNKVGAIITAVITIIALTIFFILYFRKILN